MFLQKRFHPIHIALCLNDKACVSAWNMENFRIQLSEQLRKAVLILFFEHVFFRKENLYFSGRRTCIFPRRYAKSRSLKSG